EPIQLAGSLFRTTAPEGYLPERDGSRGSLDVCDIECPAGAIQENEGTCQWGANDGCNTAPPSSMHIECGAIICGTIATFGDTLRDTDFYHIILTQQTRVIWTVRAEFPVSVAIAGVGPDCSSLPVYDFQVGDTCTSVTASACLDPGEYWLFVSTAGIFGGIPCSEYVAGLTCEPCSDCEGTDHVMFEPGTGGPQFQCVDLCVNYLLPIYVCPGGSFPPDVEIVPGCFHERPGCDIECPPAEFFYDPTAWTIDPATGCWVNFVRPTRDGCACIGFDGFLPVELLSFAATAGDGRVTLSWQTASEIDNDRFELLRDDALIARVPSQGNGANGHRYTFVDETVQNGVAYNYSLVAVDVNGGREQLAVVSASPIEGSSVVSEYALYQNYPNPFNPTTQIRFDLAEAGLVRLTIYNLTGQEVATLLNGSLAAGPHAVEFDARDLPSGMYLYRLEAADFSAVRKMMLMK
ncbi:T9SS type A sorting domain-containing protein, partial [bacterium]|nr:T9SS type A sorting domain-containing protein [bacterium]MBU1984806.1 T9SS type A sorting domain-containing protein [bacterium]